MDEFINCLKLRLNNKEILVFLNQIHLVLPIAELEPIPSKDPAFEGLLNFHSEFIPVYHFATLIDAPLPNYDLNTLIVICSLEKGLIGLLIPEALEVCKIARNAIQNPSLPASFRYVVGMSGDKKASAWLLDLEKLLLFHQQKFELHDEQAF